MTIVSSNQYWIVGDNSPATSVWSGPTGALISNTNGTFNAWLVAGDGRADTAGGGVVSTANNGSGLIRVRCGSTNRMVTGQVINFVGNNSGATGAAAITVIDGTHFDIQGSVFSVADTGGTTWSATWIDTLANLLTTPLDAFNQLITPPPFLAVTSAVNYQMTNTPPRLLFFTPTATGITVKLPQMNLPGSLAMGRELLIYNAGGIPIQVADFNGLGLMTPFGVLPGNALFSIHLTSNTSTGGTFATALILFPIEQSIGNSNASLGNFSNESLITVFPLNAALTAPRTWTLPLAASCVQGSFILIKDNAGGISSTNTLSVARNGADTINGAATSIVLDRAYDYLLLETDGISKWTICGGKGSLASTDLSDLPIPKTSGGTGNTTGQPSGAAGGYLSGTYPNPNVIKVLGVATNSNAAAGDVGEYGTGSSGSVSLTSGTAADLTSVSLAAGDYDVWGVINFNPTGSTTTTNCRAWVSVTSATDPGTGARAAASYPAGTVLAANPEVATPMQRILLSGTSNVFLSCVASFGTSTMTASGSIYWRRRR